MTDESQEPDHVSRIPEVIDQHKFDALRWLHENQTEQLHRMTLIDLRVFSGFITLQLALAAWFATKGVAIPSSEVRTGLLAVNFALAAVAAVLLYLSYLRRHEVTQVVNNCNTALGFNDSGVYLNGGKLNFDSGVKASKIRPWIGLYLVGILVAFGGVAAVVYTSPAAEKSADQKTSVDVCSNLLAELQARTAAQQAVEPDVE